jgi:hypothetical protein
MNIHRKVFFFNYLVQQFGFRNIIFRFPIGIDYFPKKIRYNFDVSDGSLIECLMFQCKGGYDKNDFLIIDDSLPMFDNLSYFEAEADAAKEITKRSRLISDQKFVESMRSEVQQCDDSFPPSNVDLEMIHFW